MRQMTIRKRVELSTYCWLISVLSTALMCGVFVYAMKQPDNEWAMWCLGGAIVILFLFLNTLRSGRIYCKCGQSMSVLMKCSLLIRV